jgi:uncharacterized protein DUF3105
LAKKRKRRPGSGTRPGGRAATSTRDRGADAPAVKPVAATPGGPNRPERKEQARRQREALRRSMSRRRFARRAGVWLAVAAAVAVVVFLIVQVSGGTGKLNNEEKQLLAQAPAAVTAAGCSPVNTVQPFNPESLDRAHIGSSNAPAAMPPLTAYRTIPPTSGPHNSVPLAAGQYPDPPPVDQVIHSLEHGAVVIWYDPSALSSKDLTDLQTFFLKRGETGKVIIAPYNYPDQKSAAKLPGGKQMVLVSWHHMQTCGKVSLPVAFDFVYHYDSGFRVTDYKGDAPEPSVPIS